MWRNTDLFLLVADHINDLCQQDHSGNNIVHCLVILSDQHPHIACDMHEALMHNTLDDDVRRKLLTSHNKNSHSALSLAADLCAPEILRRILETEGVNKFLDVFMDPTDMCNIRSQKMISSTY